MKNDDGSIEFSADYFIDNDVVIEPSDSEKAIATVAKKRGRPPKKETGLATTKPKEMSVNEVNNASIPYANSYRETDAMLHQAIMQTDILSSEIKEDLDKIRRSNTIKNKYNYITNLTDAQASLINTKISAIREINSSIKNAHDLELKRAKDMKEAQANMQNDEARLMDMYNAFINVPTGVYNPPMGPTSIDMTLGVNNPNNSLNAVPIDLQPTQSLTPEQLRMRMEGNPNIEEVVMYEPSTGRRWFEVIDKTTNAPVPGLPRSDEFLLANITIDTRAGLARNRNIDRVWRLINTENTILEY